MKRWADFLSYTKAQENVCLCSPLCKKSFLTSLNFVSLVTVTMCPLDVYLEWRTESIMTSAQPIPWSKWKKFFKSADGGVVREVTKDAFAVHYWNRMRLNSKVDYMLDKNHLLYQIFEANCPLTEERLLRRLIGSPY